MSLERRLQRLEFLLAASPDEGPSPLCTCYPKAPTFRNRAEMDVALEQECPVHGKRFRFCLVAPLALTEAEWERRKADKRPTDRSE